jgi:MOSC domain-containing protein YiiM
MSAPEPTMSDHARIGRSADANGAGHARHRGALDLYPLERILALQAGGHPISPGSIAENLPLEGIDWNAIVQGACLRNDGNPCSNIASFKHGDYAQVSRKRHRRDSRVYLRVMREARLATGNRVRIQPADEAAGLVSAR